MTDFKIRRRAKTCDVSGRPFEPGDAIVSAIYEEGDEGFFRVDMHAELFEQEKAKRAPFCFWHSRHPEPPAPPNRVDYDLAQRFFDSLLKEANPAREPLVYTLALLLSRKRRVKIQETRRLPEGELLSVVVPRAEEDEVVRVRAPRLSAEEVDGLQAEIEKLFGIGAASGPVGDAPTS